MRLRSVLIRTVVILLILAVALISCDNPTGSEDSAGSENTPEDSVDDVPEDEINDAPGEIDDAPGESTGPILRITSGEEVLTIGSTIHFNDLNEYNQQSTETITIHNDGDQPLEFTDISLGGQNGMNVAADDEPGDRVFHWVLPPSTAALAGAASRELTVTISWIHGPPEPLDALLTIESNDSEHPTRGVWLDVYADDYIQDPGGGPGGPGGPGPP